MLEQVLTPSKSVFTIKVVFLDHVMTYDGILVLTTKKKKIVSYCYFCEVAMNFFFLSVK